MSRCIHCGKLEAEHLAGGRCDPKDIRLVPGFGPVPASICDWPKNEGVPGFRVELRFGPKTENPP